MGSAYLLGDGKSSLLGGHIGERGQRREELPEDYAEAVDVNLPSMVLPFDHLRSHPSVRAREAPRVAALRLQAGDSEIGDFDRHIFRKKQVL